MEARLLLHRVKNALFLSLPDSELSDAYRAVFPEAFEYAGPAA
jgi:hypothetical protein